MSPQVHLRDAEGLTTLFEYGMRQDVSVLRLKDKRLIMVPYNNVNRLPLLYISTDLKKSESAFAKYEEGGLLDKKNQNLSTAQKIVLAWHQKLNHIGFDHVRWLAKQGYLGNKTKSACANMTQLDMPRCATCQFGKQQRRPTPPFWCYYRCLCRRRLFHDVI